MKDHKQFIDQPIHHSMMKTLKRGRFMTPENIQLPPLNIDKLETKRQGFKNRVHGGPILNLAQTKQKSLYLNQDKVSKILTDRSLTVKTIQKQRKLSQDNNLFKKQTSKLKLPTISVRNSQVVLRQIKRKKSNPCCKINIPKNCPFPFSHRTRKIKTSRVQQLFPDVDFLGLDLDISRISQVSNQSIDMEIQNFCLFQRNNI